MRYHARDMARRARAAGAAPSRCSARRRRRSRRPSNAARGRFTRLALPDRATRAAAAARSRSSTSRASARAPTASLLGAAAPRDRRHARGAEQAILFLNRRGFAPIVRCRELRRRRALPHCSVSLTFHRGRGAPASATTAATHEPAPDALRPVPVGEARARSGLGTERVEAVVARALPGRARRAARPRHRGSGGGGARAACLDRVRAGEVDILVGTQMVTKGHDFPGVTLVGVLQRRRGAVAARLPRGGADVPAARAGRRARGARRLGRGACIVQTYNPEHIAVDLARARTTTTASRERARGAARSRLSAVLADGRPAAGRVEGGGRERRGDRRRRPRRGRRGARGSGSGGPRRRPSRGSGGASVTRSGCPATTARRSWPRRARGRGSSSGATRGSSSTWTRRASL